MHGSRQLYVDGRWVEPRSPEVIGVFDPATEAHCGSVTAGSAQDVDRAAEAARRAYGAWSPTIRIGRLALLLQITDCHDARAGDLAQALTEEVGAPRALAAQAQESLGSAHFRSAA